MSLNSETKTESRAMPWGALLTGAALGAVAVLVARHLYGAGAVGHASVEDALNLCDRAADLLDDRLAHAAQALSKVV